MVIERRMTPKASSDSVSEISSSGNGRTVADVLFGEEARTCEQHDNREKDCLSQ
jgi:hypothetical protein